MKKLQILLAFAVVYIVWGSTHFAVSMVIDTVPPLAAAALRFLFAGGLLYGLSRATVRERPTAAQWRTAWILGALLPGAGNGLLFIAQQYVSPTIVALLVATEPVWIVLLAAGWLGERLRPISWVGIILGSLGIILLTNPFAAAGAHNIDLAGAGLVILATFAWASGSIYARKAATPDSAPLGAGMFMLTGGVILSGIAGLRGEWGALASAEISPESLWALFYLIVIGSVLTYSAYSFLSRNVSAGKLATYGYVNPVVGLALGGLWAGEVINTTMLVASGVIIGGAVLLAMPRPSRPRTARA